MKNKIVLLSFVLVTLILSPLAQAESFTEQTDQVKAQLGQSDETRYNYCIVGTLTCRTFVLLKDKTTHAAAEMFYNNFFSSERAVAITGYFLKNADGTYRAYSDNLFDGKVQIDTVNDWDKSIEVTFDQQGFPTLHKLYLRTLGTTKYSIADLTYNENESSIRGIRYDSADPTFSEKVEIIYRRIQN